MNTRRVAALMLLSILTAVPPAHATRVLSGQDEELQNRRRIEWLEQIHRAAPGTDWKLIEAANREQTRLQIDGVGRAPSIEAGSWSEVGADGTTGRTLSVGRGLIDSGVLYAGSALGGMWSGQVLGTSSWTPLTDPLGIGVKQIVVVPHAGFDNFVLADGNSQIYVTADGGASWSAPAGLPSGFWNARRLVQDAGAPLRVFALVDVWYWTGSAWNVHTQLLRSENGGTSFTLVHEELAADAVRSYGVEIWMDRLAGGTLWLLSGNTLKKSIDHGSTFTTVATVPGLAGDRVSLAGSEAGAPKLYVAEHVPGGVWTLYSSADLGVTWRTFTMPTDYWGTLNACISDSAQVLTGGVECYRSLNGGATFTRINGWGEYYGAPATKLHADIQGIESLIVPTGPSTSGERLYISTDGGTYLLDPAASTPQNITQFGYRNAQYYGVRTSRTAFGRISAGSQDQGYQTTTAAPSFTQQISGDYGHLTGSLSSNDMVWSCYPGFVMVQVTEDPPTLDVSYPTTNYPSDPNIPWMPSLLADPDDPASALFGGRYLWEMTRTSPGHFASSQLWDFGTNPNDAVGAVGIAPSDHQRWYVATYHGYLYYSTDGGTSFNLSGSSGPTAHYFYGSDILVSPTNPLVAYVCGSGYSNPAVYRTTDGGVTWSPFGSGMPPTLAHRLAFDNDADQTLYAATEAGPFRCVGGVWENLISAVPGAPLTTYWDVESIPDHGIVRFATYGRGLWDFYTGGATAVGPSPGAARVALAVNPNPSPGAATLSYTLPAAGPVRLDVFDLSGRRVAAPLDEWRPAGTGAVRFTGRDDAGHPLAAGIYLVRLEAAGHRDVRKLFVRR